MSAEKVASAPETLLSALLSVQKAIPTLKLGKDATNPAFKSKYITLDKLMDEVLPLLNAHGLIWVTMPSRDELGPVLLYKLTHVDSKEEAEGEMPLMLDKQNSQGLGSALTYARRQSLMAVVGLCAHEDDDGEKASKQSEQPTVLKKPEHKLLDLEALAQLEEACENAGRDIRMAAKAVGKDSKDELTVKDGFDILEKIKAKAS